jgi:hypothetical protein
VSRYDRFRKRLAPIAFLAAIALLARDSCLKEQRLHATVELAFAAERPRVREVAVEVVAGGDTIATYRRVAQPGAEIEPCRFKIASPVEDGELRIDIDLGASHQHLTRAFHAADGATITVSIPDAP